MKKFSALEMVGGVYILMGILNYFQGTSNILLTWVLSLFGALVLAGGYFLRQKRNKKIAEQPEPKRPTLSYSSQRKRKK